MLFRHTAFASSAVIGYFRSDPLRTVFSKELFIIPSDSKAATEARQENVSKAAPG